MHQLVWARQATAARLARQVAAAALPGERCEVERCVLNGRLKAVTAYFGALAATVAEAGSGSPSDGTVASQRPEESGGGS